MPVPNTGFAGDHDSRSVLAASTKVPFIDQLALRSEMRAFDIFAEKSVN
jgi:hypothetical protein